jgi:hypothetical protein
MYTLISPFPLHTHTHSHTHTHTHTHSHPHTYTHIHTHAHTHTGKGLNSAPYSQLSNDLKSGSISEFRYEDLDLGGSFDGEGGFGMGNLRGSESDLVGIGAVHSQWQLTRYVQ